MARIFSLGNIVGHFFPYSLRCTFLCGLRVTCYSLQPAIGECVLRSVIMLSPPPRGDWSYSQFRVIRVGEFALSPRSLSYFKYGSIRRNLISKR